MTDSGLSTRLRQQSRRAGLMVGITMALAIAILIFGAAGLFAWLSRPFSDLIPVVAPAAEIAAPDVEDAPVVEVPTAAPDLNANSAPAEEPTIAVAEATEEPDEFDPTHQIAAAGPVNLRPEPSVNNTPIIALQPATALQYLDDEAPTTDSADGARWMRFRTEAGQEGWVREIDTGPYQP